MTETQIPENVKAASERLQARLQERSLLEDRSKIPSVFRDIIKNHNEQAQIFARGATMSQSDWRRLGELKRDFKQSLRPGAEKMLHWNNDKGNVS